MRFIVFKSNSNLMAFRESNSFGDQEITIVDISKGNDSRTDYYGQAVLHNVEIEGSHVEFTESKLLSMLKDQAQ